MHKTTAESAAAVRRIGRLLQTLRGGRAPEVFIAPSFTALKAVAEAVRGTRIIPTAQNAHWEPHGAYT
ncbi:MAG TPA: triose-phosphate isomerase, partial [Nitrospiria bacterium]